MGRTIADLIRYREVLYMLTWREIKIRYKQSVLGAAWALLMPLIIVSAGVAVRFAFATMSGGHTQVSDIAAVAVKSAPYGFLVAAIRFGTNSLVSNQNLLTKVFVPRLIFPLSAVLAQLFDFLIACSVLGIAVLLVGTGVSLQLLWLPVLFVALVALVAASAILLSAASLFFRDVKYLVEVLLTFAVFFVPVFYDARMFGKWETVLMLNPLSPILESVSATVVRHTAPNIGWLGYSLAFGFALLWASLVIFQKLDPFFAESV
jgi:lipopolysaccharide transport system permease protein